VHEIIDRHPIAEILDARSALLGEARVPYEGHAYRVFNFCRALHGAGADDDAIAVASAFHDLAVFPDGNRLPRAFDRDDARMGYHQWSFRARRRSGADDRHASQDLFRQADLIDVALGAIRFGLPKEFVRDVRVRFPNAGFHGALVGVIGRWIVRHPTNPLPVFKL
jgi:hypothetical protein